LWKPRFAAFAATGVILSAVYMLWMFQRVNYGQITNEKNRTLPDLTPREWALMVPTIAMAIVMGVFPMVFLRPMEPSVRKTVERVTGRSFAEAPGSGMRDPGSGIRSSDRPSGIAHLPSGTAAPTSRIPDPASRIPDPGVRPTIHGARP
jgi:hypothetical protein